MQLDDLKTAWKSIEPRIGTFPTEDIEKINLRHDVKSCIIKRFQWGIALVTVATVLLATSRSWAVIKMPVWWLTVFCILFVAGIMAMLRIIHKVRRIDLAEDSPIQVIRRIVSVKRFYRNAELYGSAFVIVLTICGLFVSPVRYTPVEIAFITLLTAVCFLMEYFAYRSNIKKINKIQTWLKES